MTADTNSTQNATTGSAPTLDKATRTELEAAAFRRLVEHLRGRTDVQNIDLMNLAGFCRNCLSKWMKEEAAKRGVPLDYEQAREEVYGMPYDTWKQLYQRDASPDQHKHFAAVMADPARHG